ncbi:MAG: restriction endonuclease subunit S [Sulfuritalea sp.]|nr:restriction endonuclease subunit S [Sulfuritalea sp.]
MSEWVETTIGEIAASTRNALVGGPFGSNLVSADYTTDGVPVIRGQNMGSRWVSGEFAYVSPEKAQTLQANLARPGDIVFTQRGTLGQVALVPDGGFSSYVISQSQMKLTVDRAKADPLFLFYVFSSPEQQEYIRQNAIQVGVPHTNLGILRDTPISLPPLSNQLAIAHILGTLDDKIELNRRMNETLEATARAIFKSWFVDFDPVRAKAGGEPPESICRRLGLTPDVLALFPGSFQDSELGEIPKGWSVRSLDDVADFLNGLALQKYPATGDEWLPVIKIAQLRAGHTLGADRANTEIPPAYVIENGDVLFSWSGSLEVEIWCGGQGALNQHLFKVTSAEFPKWFYLLWTRHHLRGFRDIAANKATTMGHIQRKHLTDAKVLCPSEKLLAAMGATFDPLISKIINGRLETNELAALRDTLLPKLLSGELSPNHVPAESLQ